MKTKSFLEERGFKDPEAEYIRKIETQLNNRDIRRRYRERKQMPLKQGEEFCVFGCIGWFCLNIEHEKHHDLNLDGLLKLTQEDIANLDIKKLICPYHI